MTAESKKGKQQIEKQTQQADHDLKDRNVRQQSGINASTPVKRESESQSEEIKSKTSNCKSQY